MTFEHKVFSTSFPFHLDVVSDVEFAVRQMSAYLYCDIFLYNQIYLWLVEFSDFLILLVLSSPETSLRKHITKLLL